MPRLEQRNVSLFCMYSPERVLAGQNHTKINSTPCPLSPLPRPARLTPSRSPLAERHLILCATACSQAVLELLATYRVPLLARKQCLNCWRRYYSPFSRPDSIDLLAMLACRGDTYQWRGQQCRAGQGRGVAPPSECSSPIPGKSLYCPPRIVTAGADAHSEASAGVPALPRKTTASST